MNKKKIIQIIKEIEALLSVIKDEIDLSEKEGQVIVEAEIKKIPNKSKKKLGLAKSILELTSNGFMDTGKTAMDLSREFKKQAFNYDTDAIRTALMRLVRKSLLEREGDGTFKNPWKYKKKS